MNKGLIFEMYKRSGGKEPLHTCAECDYLVVFKRKNKNISKCLLFGDDGTSDTDWDKGQCACKSFKAKIKPSGDETPDQVEGQMNIFDFLS